MQALVETFHQNPVLGPTLIFAAIIAPALAAVILMLPFRLGRAGTTTIASLGSAVAGVAAVILWCVYRAQETGDFMFIQEVPQIGLEQFGISLKVGLNGISMPLFLLSGLVSVAATLYAAATVKDRVRSFLVLLLIMEAGLMGVFASVDLFFFYFFHEIALIPTFFMIGIWGTHERRQVALELTVFLTVGAMATLAGLIVLYVQSELSSFDLITLRAHFANVPMSDIWQEHTAGLLLLGFGVLVALFPFHLWAPRGYATAPAPTTMLHAGVLKKFGLYGLVQIALPLVPAGMEHWVPLLLFLAIGNVLVVGFITMAQRNLRYMLGYGSVMHMGYIFLGIATLGDTGIGGAVLLMFGHGLSVALLFLLGDAVVRRTGTAVFDEMGGLVKSAPVLGAFFVAAVMASVGLPGFANFWGEFTIFFSLWEPHPWFAAAAIAGIVISAVYGLRAAATTFMGDPKPTPAAVTSGDLTWSERAPALLLFAGLLIVGLWPRSVTQSLEMATDEVIPAAHRLEKAPSEEPVAKSDEAVEAESETLF